MPFDYKDKFNALIMRDGWSLMVEQSGTEKTVIELIEVLAQMEQEEEFEKCKMLHDVLSVIKHQVVKMEGLEKIKDLLELIIINPKVVQELE